MPIEKTKKQLYLFIRNSKDDKLWHYEVKKYSHDHKISQQEMGYALTLLRKDGAISYNRKRGWVAK